MKLFTRIVCRTAGAAGIAISCYDAAKISNQFSTIGSGYTQEKYLEDAYFSSRTMDEVSHTSNAIREKTFELRSKNPIPGTLGKIKGGFQGFMYGLANHLPIIACSALAILGKNILAKVGAIGVGAIALYKIFREGFGVGKSNPMS